MIVEILYYKDYKLNEAPDKIAIKEVDNFLYKDNEIIINYKGNIESIEVDSNFNKIIVIVYGNGQNPIYNKTLE